MIRTGVAAVALGVALQASLLTGCSNTEHSNHTMAGAATPNSGNPGSAPADPGRVLKKAIARLIVEDTGRFDETLSIRGTSPDYGMSSSGTYGFSTRNAILDTRIETPNQPAGNLSFRLTGHAIYLQARADDQPHINYCWVRMPEHVLTTKIGLPTVQVSSRFPANLQALKTAVGRRIDESDPNIVHGDVSLTPVAGAMAPRLALPLMRHGTRVRVPATFTLFDGNIDMWTVSGRDLAVALTRTGMHFTKLERTAIGLLNYEVVYRDAETKHLVVPAPPRNRTQTAADRAAGRRC